MPLLRDAFAADADATLALIFTPYAAIHFLFIIFFFPSPLRSCRHLVAAINTIIFAMVPRPSCRRPSANYVILIFFFRPSLFQSVCLVCHTLSPSVHDMLLFHMLSAMHI